MSDSEHLDETDDGAGDRERALAERESRADARDAAQAHRDKHAEDILADAEVRDEKADARDCVADSRDRVASLNSVLRDTDADHDAALKARRAGALDRQDSKGDRTDAADDRSRLTQGGGPAVDEDDQ